MRIAAPWKPLPRALRRFAAEQPGAVLLETGRQDGSADESLLFLEPEAELVAWNAEDIDPLLREVDRLLTAGRCLAGFFSYECGEHFVGLPPRGEVPGTPLIWLGVYREPVRFRHSDGRLTGHPPRSLELFASAETLQADPVATAARWTAALDIDFADYAQRVSRIQHYLCAGDSYQVNFTDRLCGEAGGNLLALYESLLAQQPVPFAALVHRPEQPLISCSPEMFFRVCGRRVTVRPMKGTWTRGVNLAEERHHADLLRCDEKNRSEHVTIVDLLRNDGGRIAEPGSVVVEALFAVEAYRTLLQMTSTVSGALREDITPTAVLRALFPSGSITGAPKRRTMEIVREVERGPRGVYTGAIGYFAPDGAACFNVAIRTLTLSAPIPQGRRFTMGVGGGITLDSRAEDEYAECQLKSSFLTQQQPPFALLETMRAEDGRVALLAAHMDRLQQAAGFFRIAYAGHALVQEVTAAALACGPGAHRLRLTLNEAGRADIAVSTLEEVPWQGRVLLSDERSNAGNLFLHHKTTNRAWYDERLAAAHAAGFDEVLFLNEAGQLTEGAISNVFLRVHGQWVTPALRCGVLPGVQRAALLRQLPGVSETLLTRTDLQAAQTILVCNALRGTRRVEQVVDAQGAVIWRAAVPQTETSSLQSAPSRR